MQRFGSLFILSSIMGAVLSLPATGQVITPNYLDGGNEGFNDPTATTSPITGMASTLGADRRAAFEAALAEWANLLDLSVNIVVNANFDPLGGTETSATLGSAGATTIHFNFPGAPRANTWFSQAEANQISGTDQSVQNDISTTFNSSVDNSTVLGTKDFYYGTDRNNGSDIDFFEIALHEICHGLGFFDTLGSNGSLNDGMFDIYAVHLRREGSVNLDFVDMTQTQRSNAMRSVDELVWNGAAVAAEFGSFPKMFAPSTFDAGSSISHWDETNMPDLLMEPSDTSASTTITLEEDLFEDISWPLAGPGLPQAEFTQTLFSTNESSGSVTLKVKLSAAPTVMTETVEFSTREGGSNPGTSGVDWTPDTDTISWNVGDRSTKDITISIVDDVTDMEGVETFLVDLSNPSAGIELGGLATAQVSIIDPDALPASNGWAKWGFVIGVCLLAGAFFLRERKPRPSH